MKDVVNEEGPDVSAGAAEEKHEQEQIAPADVRAEPLFTLAAAGYELIPLYSFDSFDRKGRNIGKAPIGPKWRELPAMDGDEAADHLRGGSNVGVRLSPLDLVVDYDPRGDDARDALDRLMADFKLAECPRVLTGGGGVHLYLRLPEPCRYAESLEGYPGVEFKGFGRQVVAPGSIHPNGRAYALELDVLSDDLAQEAPSALLAALVKPERVEEAEAGRHTPEELETMLAGLEPTAFNKHDDWLKMMMACHHATAGEGREEFIRWSTSDPVYAGDAWIIGRRWDSLRADRAGSKITVKTLYQALHNAGHGGLIPEEEVESAAEAFADVDAEPVERALAKKPEREVLNGTSPMAIARGMLKGRAVLRSNGDWLRYDRSLNAYVEEDAEAFEARVWNWTDGRLCRPKKGAEGEDGEERRLVAKGSLVANVTAAARSQRQGPRVLPAWHPLEEGDPAPSDLLAVRNGLLNLATGELLPATPRFVNRNASPVIYDPSAPEPQRWHRFLAEVLEGDHEARDTLQEVMGYLLTQDTSQQKIFCIVGPKRCGKGTINRITQLLVGDGNYTSPTSRDLAKDFGLQPLIGRSLATISDMRMGKSDNVSAFVENLLRVSGEDEVSVNRKFKTAWEGRLGARFLILSNEAPQFRDTSGAIVSRLILIRTRVSFFGREDLSLMHALRAELPGILNWALEGLARLRARGHFVQPASSKGELRKMTELTSPVKAFADARLGQSAEAVVPKDAIWLAFQGWLEEMGHVYTGTKGHFFKDLGTVGLTFEDVRVRVDGDRVQSVKGLELLLDD